MPEIVDTGAISDATADFYLKRGRWKRAEEIAREMIARHPDQN